MKYEAHLTVEPREGEAAFAVFSQAASDAGWKVSKFDHDDVDGIAGKWFLTYGSDVRNVIIGRTLSAITSLAILEYEVTRWKVEQTLFDSKAGDTVDAMMAAEGWEKV